MSCHAAAHGMAGSPRERPQVQVRFSPLGSGSRIVVRSRERTVLAFADTIEPASVLALAVCLERALEDAPLPWPSPARPPMARFAAIRSYDRFVPDAELESARLTRAWRSEPIGCRA